MNTKIIFLSFIVAFLSTNVLFGQDNYRTLVYEGNKKFKDKDYDGASSVFMEAAKSKPKDFTAHYNLGNALYKNKKYDEAKAEYEKAQKLSQTIQDKAAALHNLGNTYMQTNQPEKAAEYYKLALKQNPYNEVTRKNYEIAKLKEKENNSKKEKENKSGQSGGKREQQKEGKGDTKEKQDQGTSQQNKGEGKDNNGNETGEIPKEVEKAIMNRVGEKENQTARKILNKDSYLAPESNEKDW